MISVAHVTLTADGYFDAHEALNSSPYSSIHAQRALNLGCFLMFTFVIITGSLILLTLVTAVLVSSFNPEIVDGAGDLAQGEAGALAHGESPAKDRVASPQHARDGLHAPMPARQLKANWSRKDHLKCALNRLMPHRFAPVAVDDAKIAERNAQHERDFKSMLARSTEYKLNHWDILEAEAGFRLADRDDDRKLSLEEAKSIFAEMGFDYKRREVAEQFNKFVARVDNEGNNLLEFDEFIQLITLIKAQQKREGDKAAVVMPRASHLKLRKPRLVRDRHRGPVPEEASNFYRRLYWIVHHPTYELFSTMLIALSVVLLALEYSEFGSERREALRASTAVITAFFIGDIFMTMYVISFTEFFLTPARVLDMVVVATTVVSLVATDVPGLDAIRALRVLRIFQLLSEFKEMRLLIESLSVSRAE